MIVKDDWLGIRFAKDQDIRIEADGSDRGIERFFIKEQLLLDHLFRSEKKEAQQVVRSILNTIIIHTENQGNEQVKYYLISLSSLITRRLLKSFTSLQRAFNFNMACYTLIKLKLNEDNTFELADQLIEFYIHEIVDKQRSNFPHDKVNEVILFINEEVEYPLTVEYIATNFDVSTSHLSRIFREHTGITLVEYITIRKVEESQYYLRFTDKKISFISDHFNFCNQSYFTRVFKKYTGQTPKDFRRDWNGEYFHFSFPTEEPRHINGHSL